MTPLEILAIAGVVAAVAVILYIITNDVRTGNIPLALALFGGFSGYTAVTIAREGVMPLWLNHTNNLWGIQVWWDLLLSVGIALFFIAPRARKVGMSIAPWALFVAATASIGLLAMVARVFWLERSAAGEA